MPTDTCSAKEIPQSVSRLGKTMEHQEKLEKQESFNLTRLIFQRCYLRRGAEGLTVRLEDKKSWR